MSQRGSPPPSEQKRLNKVFSTSPSDKSTIRCYPGQFSEDFILCPVRLPSLSQSLFAKSAVTGPDKASQLLFAIMLKCLIFGKKNLSWMNRSQTNNNKKGDLSKVFRQKCLTNWPRSSGTRDASLGSAANLLCDLGPVTDPLCGWGGWARGCPRPLSAQTVSDLLHKCYTEGI